eukprot:1397933-Prorocentrum_lima.AAC.1
MACPSAIAVVGLREPPSIIKEFVKQSTTTRRLCVIWLKNCCARIFNVLDDFSIIHIMLLHDTLV